MEGKLSKNNLTCEVIVGKNGTDINLKGQPPNSVADLYFYADKKSDLHLLHQYPNIEKLVLSGKISEVDSLLELKHLKELKLYGFSGTDFISVKELSLKVIHVVNCAIGENFSALLSESLEYLHLGNIKKMEDLTFVEKATGLKKLYIEDTPWVEVLPDFSKLKKLYALKLYGLHKLNNIESLVDSNIEYLAFTLVADKFSGTKFAEIILQMKSLKQADMYLLDRSDRRLPALKNRLAKEGKEHLLAKFDYDDWIKL